MNNPPSIMWSFIPGFVQGMTKVSISYPFDIVKLKKQSTQKSYNEIFKYVYNHPYILYKKSSLYYITFPFIRSLQYYCAEYENINHNYLYSGFIAGIIGGVLNTPINHIWMDSITHNKTVITCIKNSILDKSIYKGYRIEILRSILNTTAYISSYYYFRDIVSYYNSNNSKIYMFGVCGCMSHIICTLLFYPLDMIRTDIYINKLPMIKIIKNRYITYGIKGYYTGILPVLFKSLPSSFITMYCYEYVKKIIYK